MFLLALFGLLVLEVIVFIEVGLAIGWLAAVALLVGISFLGILLVLEQGRVAIARVSLAVSEQRAPARAAIDGGLGFLGAGLLAIPGFVTDALGVLLLFPPTRALARRRISNHFVGRMMGFVAASARYAPGVRRTRPADVDSTAIDEDADQLGR